MQAVVLAGGNHTKYYLLDEKLKQISVLNQFCFCYCCCCYMTPYEGGGMAEDHGASEARQLPRVWTRGLKRERVAKERAVQRVYS